MNRLTNDQFEPLLKAAPIKPRFKRDVKFVTSTEHMDDTVWAETELLPIWNKSKNGGILLLQPDDDVYFVAFDSTKPTVDGGGRVKPLICDLCYTWRTSGEGGFVTFYPNKGSNDTLSILCCADLQCSANVRTKTAAALKSRTQLRESISPEGRVERLRQKMREFITRTGIEPVGDS